MAVACRRVAWCILRVATLSVASAASSVVRFACCMLQAEVPFCNVATCFVCMLHAAALPVACCSSVYCILSVLLIASSSLQRVCVACRTLHVASGLLRMVNSRCILSFACCMSVVACCRVCKLHAVCCMRSCVATCRRMHVFMLHVTRCSLDVVCSARCTSVASHRLCMPCAGKVARCVLQAATLSVASCLLGPRCIAVLFAACCCFVFWVARFVLLQRSRCMVCVACCMLHVACCARLLHVAAFELHGTCSGSHVAYIVVTSFAGVLHVARLVRCVWLLLQVAISAARYATPVLQFMLHVAWCGWCVLQRPHRRTAAHAHTPAGSPRSVVTVTAPPPPQPPPRLRLDLPASPPTHT